MILPSNPLTAPAQATKLPPPRRVSRVRSRTPGTSSTKATPSYQTDRKQTTDPDMPGDRMQTTACLLMYRLNPHYGTLPPRN